MKSKDLRVIKTHEAILNTFKEMICEMDANKITVRELAERARIHRQTFYLHYPSLDALFDEVIREMLNKQERLWSAFPSTMDSRDAHRIFFEQMAANEKYEERILCHSSHSEYCIKYFDLGTSRIKNYISAPDNLSKEEQDLIFRFMNVNLNDFYRQWVAGGKKMPVERLVELSDRMIRYGMSGFVDLP